MRERIPFAIVLWLCLAAAGRTLAGGQENPVRPEGLSARIDNAIQMSRDKIWTPAEPSKNIGVIVNIRLVPHTTYKPEEFTVAYGDEQRKQTAPCLGYATGGGWFLAEKEGEALTGVTLTTGGKAAEVPFLFVVPKDVSQVTLLYMTETTGKALSIK